MKHICTICQRVSVDGNLWCQEPDCPAGNMPLIFDYGEWLADIQVTRLLCVLRHAAIYEAERAGMPLLLKVAHPGCQDQLRREARVLAELAQSQQHPMLPVLLPAYQQADLRQRPYGKTVFKDETKYYIVFEHAEGEFLRDMLLKNPQPWYQHAAWITISLADAIAFLHIKGKRLHLNLSPDVIFVRTDKVGIPRPMLLDLGLLAEPGSIVNPSDVHRYTMPAYVAPEALAGNTALSPAADVYGLGIVLHEMLAGQPAFRFANRHDDDVRADVLRGLAQPLARTDLSEEIHGIVHMAVNRAPEQRQQDVRAFAKLLRTKFGEVPAEKKRNWNRRIMAAVVVIALLTIVVIMISALLG